MKNFLAKTVSIFLICLGIYNLGVSVVEIFDYYPKIMDSTLGISRLVRRSLIEKAIMMYVSMVVDALYGVALLVKPSEKVKIAHVILGWIIFAGSVFFVTKPEAAGNPVISFVVDKVEGLIDALIK